jgi:preprotein translocase subunit SecE
MASLFVSRQGRGQVVKPLEFINQVQTETKKVVWASRKQTMMTALMVMIMTSILGLFFLGVDRALGALVHFLLSLAKG